MKKVLAILVMMAVMVPSAMALDWDFETTQGEATIKVEQIVLFPQNDAMLIRAGVYATVNGEELKVKHLARKVEGDEYNTFITENLTEDVVGDITTLLSTPEPVEEEV